MKAGEDSVSSDFCVALTAAIFVVGLVVLGVRLKELQLDDAGRLSGAAAVQAERRVSVPGVRGRIVDREGRCLAGNRATLSLSLSPAAFQGRNERTTVSNVLAAVAQVSKLVGRTELPDEREVVRHLRRRQSMPMTVWRQLDDREIAVFAEHAAAYPGFSLEEDWERCYPYGRLAAHLIGFTGRNEVESAAEGVKIHFRGYEQRGREGLERYYDDFLRGASGEMLLTVDARGYAVGRRMEIPPSAGPDLRLSLDVDLQRTAERELAGLRGACVAIDPRDGAVLALASAPGYDLNECVPTLSHEVHSRLENDPALPRLNRATSGAYAPGSTFKPVTALAALRAGVQSDVRHDCDGLFRLGALRLRCSRRRGHGSLDVVGALRESCNPFFCSLAIAIGTNALCEAARDLGLGAKTGIDYVGDFAGVVPDADWKMRHYRERWYPGDLAQMGIGQGMLLVSPLQMALVAGAIGTGRLVKPRLKADLPVESERLGFSERALSIVREGMRQVVDGGTGKHGGEGVGVPVCGKTGTAEIGRGQLRRKNTWFLAYAPAEKPEIAVALVVENGESGGGTSAPKVAAVLREWERKRDLARTE